MCKAWPTLFRHLNGSKISFVIHELVVGTVDKLVISIIGKGVEEKPDLVSRSHEIVVAFQHVRLLPFFIV